MTRRFWTPEVDGISAEQFVNDVNALGIKAVSLALRRNERTVRRAFDRLTNEHGGIKQTDASPRRVPLDVCDIGSRADSGEVWE